MQRRDRDASAAAPAPPSMRPPPRSLPLLLLLPTLSAALLAAGCGHAGADAARGEALLAQYQCGSCHHIPDVPGARGGVGPPLDAFGARSYIAGQLPNRADTLARWIADPAALVPGTAMPDMGASERDASDMAAYLLSLQ